MRMRTLIKLYAQLADENGKSETVGNWPHEPQCECNVCVAYFAADDATRKKAILGLKAVIDDQYKVISQLAIDLSNK